MVCLISSEAEESQNPNPAKGERQNYAYFQLVKATFSLALHHPF